MWIFWSCVSIVIYSFCLIYEKKGVNINEKYCEIKMLIWFGICGLLVSIFVSIFNLRETSASFIKLFIESPPIILSTLFYYASLLLSFISLKFIPVSIETPIANTYSCFTFIGAILLFLSLGEYQKITTELTPEKVVLVVIIFIVLIIFSILYRDEVKDNEESNLLDKKATNSKSKILFYATVGIILAVLSSITDAFSSIVDYYILNDVIGTVDYLYFYNLLFFILAVFGWVYVSVKEKKIYNPFKKDQYVKAIGSGLDCLGTVTATLAINANQFYADPLISTTFIFTVVLSRIMLKEKLNWKQYICVIVLVLCIVGFAILDA